MYTYVRISLNSSQNDNVSEKCCRENQMFSNFFF